MLTLYTKFKIYSIKYELMNFIIVPFQIKYKFKDDVEYYICTVTYQQYKNFKKLPIVVECNVINEDDTNMDEYKKEMQNALNLAAKNDTSHIKKLSQIVK